MNRQQRRAQAAQTRAADSRDGTHLPPDLCVCCNARKVLHHLIMRDEPLRAGDGQPVAFSLGGNHDHAVAEFGVLRIELDMKTARFDLYALGERVAWFDPDHFVSECGSVPPPWIYTLAAIREQLDRRLGPVNFAGCGTVH